MATHLVPLLLLMCVLVLSISAINDDPPTQDTQLAIAVAEMQSSSYFTFAMLVSMLRDRIPANITFLMPSDRLISRLSMSESAVSSFLFSHSIPMPLLLEHLKHFPSGSEIPTFEPDFMLRVSNNGGKMFSLDNVEIVRPNICLAGSSIRCHGINGILNVDGIRSSGIVSPPPPQPYPNRTQIAESPHGTPPSVGSRNLTYVAAPPSIDSNPGSQSAPPSIDSNPGSQTAPPWIDSDPKRSGSSDRISGLNLVVVMTCLVMLLCASKDAL